MRIYKGAHDTRVSRSAQGLALLVPSSGDMVWLENRRRRKGENPKLQAKFDDKTGI